VCKSHVKRNTGELIASLQAALVQGTDQSLAALGTTPEQAKADLERLGHLLRTRQMEEQTELEVLHLLLLDRWNVWPLLTHYRTWRGPNGETIDSTNNACEHGIGWWIKERHRTMCGYNRPQSTVTVSRLWPSVATSWAVADWISLRSSPNPKGQTTICFSLPYQTWNGHDNMPPAHHVNLPT
jgi:hypothetical protein